MPYSDIIRCLTCDISLGFASGELFAAVKSSLASVASFVVVTSYATCHEGKRVHPGKN